MTYVAPVRVNAESHYRVRCAAGGGGGRNKDETPYLRGILGDGIEGRRENGDKKRRGGW